MNRQRKTFRELDRAVAQLERMVRSGEVGLVRSERVKRALIELKKARKGGQFQPERLARAVALLSEEASDQFLR